MPEKPILEIIAAEVAASPVLELGESIRVDEARGLVWFVDIAAKKLFRVPLAKLNDPAAYIGRDLPEEPGFVAVASEADTVILGLPGGVYRYCWASEELQLVASYAHEPGAVRVNDGAVSPWGEIWFGTMNLVAGAPAGYLYRIEGEACIKVDGPASCWNGIGWSPDGREMYATDTLGGKIRRYRRAERVDEPEVHSWLPVEQEAIEPPGGASGWLPDGLLVDPQGGVWSALWDGARVVRMDPGAGSVIDVIVHTPGGRPTSLALLPDGRMLITGAAVGELPGRLYCASTGLL